MAFGNVIATAIVQIKADTTGFRSAVNGLAGGLNSSFTRLKNTIGALGLGHLASEAIRFGAEYRIQMDNARAAVIGLTDSTAEADALYKEMVQFAIATPFDLPGVQNATTRLLAFGESFGVTSDNVVDYVRIIGDAAASTGKGTDAINNVITVLGKISGQGRVMTRDMNQLTANFPSLHPWEILSEVTGKSVEELRRLAILPGGLSGVVDATEFIDALVKGMEEMPGAAGAMDRRMQTLGGTVEIFKDTMGVALADGLQPFFSEMQKLMLNPDIQNALTMLAETFGALASMIAVELAPVLPSLINAFQHIVVALMPAAPAFADLLMIFAMGLVTMAPLIEALAQVATNVMNLLMQLDPGILGAIAAALIIFWIAFTGPMSLVIIGILALVAAIQMFWPEITAATEVMVAAVVDAWNWLFENIIGPVRDFIMAIVDFFVMLYDTLIGNSIIPDIVNGIVEWFDKLFGWISDIVSAIVNFITDHWQLLIGIMLGPLGIILALVITHWDSIKAFITAAVNAIKSTVESVWNTIKSFLSTVWNTIKTVATTVWDGIKSAIVDPITDAVDTAKEKVQNILDKVRSAWSGIVAFVQGVWNGVKSAITTPIQAAYDFVKGKVDAIAGLVQGAIDTISNIPGAGVVGNAIGWLTGHAEGGVFTRPHMGLVAERGAEAIIPLSNPMRAMQVMHQAGLDRLVGQMQARPQFAGPLVSMPGAVIQDATDADLVAQRTLVAMTAAMVA